MIKKIGVRRIDNRTLLDIGNESIEINDYQVRSSADGTTELLITIRGTSEVFELSASLKEQMQSSQ